MHHGFGGLSGGTAAFAKSCCWKLLGVYGGEVRFDNRAGVRTGLMESGGISGSGRRKKNRVHLMEGHANKIG